ncbi:UDP-N-acetylmuramoyl-tripeptide--D-alanyl-D-alanine ligase [Clostridium sp. P21]|uniref:UDP-N-acetylmuramoyl-tripeptide--D-alanyl-D-alanine ligase n=1 Tax=Clostridium muellerianum TaxID=2716538 RepID=A0A7Y0EDD4_9CLOT|nr:UDP-N-acetylmuramoyl-tripeptide--D-alanyl-D-alanine ligase [Clostridium muellerianum]NMM61421.1 UDP-N-acetylmuramoyl-tripeptide--D-alanyl-D-alanine ligase [Clostridium muellerianum]
MEHMTFSEIVNAVQGQVVLQGDYDNFNEISTDTRKIGKGNIFIALKGENFNGNEYIEAASSKGAVICIIDEIKYKEDKIEKGTTIIKVRDTKKALLDLAKAYRSKLGLKVIGITGSNGKTSTKDLLAAALSSKYKVFKTEGNFNNEIGLPLMIFKLDNSYDIAVLEMGMNNLNEIHRMAEAAKPDIALITNVGVSHIGNLKTRDNILKAKLEITDFFNEKSILIINGDNDLLSKVQSSKFSICKTGMEDSNDFKASEIELKESFVEFKVEENGKKHKEVFHVEIPGKHTISNSLLAIACGKILGMEYEDIKEGLKNLQTTAMRMDIIKGKNFNILNDCYNANPDSMKVAIDVLKNIDSNRRIAVLGTMGELGEESCKAHKEVGEYAAKNGVDLLLTFGEYNKAFEEGFKVNNKSKYKAFGDYSEGVRYLVDEYLKSGDTVLVKASRSMKFEKIVEELKKNNL